LKQIAQQQGLNLPEGRRSVRKGSVFRQERSVEGVRIAHSSNSQATFEAGARDGAHLNQCVDIAEACEA